MQLPAGARLPAAVAQLLRRTLLPTGQLQLQLQHTPLLQHAGAPCASCGTHKQRPHTTGSADHAHKVGSQEHHCWKCDFRVQRGGLVCKACDSIQPTTQRLSHFALLDLPEGVFDIDTEDLEKRYKALQWKLHPDKAVGKSRLEQLYAAEHATAVNEAYSVLKDPLSRANYILSQQGRLGAESEATTIINQELLMEVMEAREQVEETDNQQELQSIRAGVQAAYTQLVGKLSRAFAHGDSSSAEQLTVQLRYLARLLEEIHKKLD